MDNEELMEVLDELVERGLSHGMFDDNGELWKKCAKLTNRDPDSGNRL